MRHVRVRLAPFLAASLLLTAVACQPAREDPANVERILLVGDSLAWGAYAAPGLRHHLHEAFPNAAIVALGGPATSPGDGYDGGEWSTWAMEVNHWVSSGFDADLVIIQACCDRPDMFSFLHGLNATIKKARTHDPEGDRRVMLVTSPRLVPGRAPFYEFYGVHHQFERANYWIRQIPDVAVADLDAAWSVNGEPVWEVPGIGVTRYLDGLHFNDAGARAAVQLLAQT
jgi:lysophospholipase L1-like esterase